MPRWFITPTGVCNMLALLTPLCSKNAASKSVCRAPAILMITRWAERFMRTLKEEEVYLSDYDDIREARHSIGHFLESVYNHKRLHSALGYLPPTEFEQSLQP